MTRIRWKISGYFWHIFSCNVTWMFLETNHQPFGAGKITNLSKFTIFYNTSEVGEHHILLGAVHVEVGEKRITTPFRFWKWLDNPVAPKKVQLSFCLGGVVNSTKKTP